MEIVSRYHISGSNTFAIVEGQSLSELKDPSGRAVGRFEALGKVWLNEIFLINLSQTGPEESLAVRCGELVVPGPRVKRIGCRTRTDTHPKGAASLRCIGAGGNEQLVAYAQPNASREGEAPQIPT